MTGFESDDSGGGGEEGDSHLLSLGLLGRVLGILGLGNGYERRHVAMVMTTAATM